MVASLAPIHLSLAVGFIFSHQLLNTTKGDPRNLWPSRHSIILWQIHTQIQRQRLNKLQCSSVDVYGLQYPLAHVLCLGGNYQGNYLFICFPQIEHILNFPIHVQKKRLWKIGLKYVYEGLNAGKCIQILENVYEGLNARKYIWRLKCSKMYMKA